MAIGELRKQREQSDRPLAVLDGHNPTGLARSFMRQNGLFGKRDEDELLSVAMMAVVDAALSWDPKGGSFAHWAYGYMRTYVFKHLRRDRQHRSELGRQDCVSIDPDRYRYRGGMDEYSRVELRVDLQRWADLAQLNPLQRFVVEYAAYHAGVSARREGRSPLSSHTYKQALGHMRQAAITGERRDDVWTRRRDRVEFERKSLEKVAAWREALDGVA